jgi:hypothetical protein
MSDLLVVRGIKPAEARPLLGAWAAAQKWVKSAELRDAWEPQELEINGRNAVAFMRGKHKDDLAGLVRFLQEHGGQVVHMMLHRRPVDRVEEDLAGWASRRAGRRTLPPSS